MSKPPFALQVLIALAVLVVVAVPDGLAIDALVEEAILKNNWQAGLERLQLHDTLTGDPVARLLMAHASLATNRNNATLLLFLSVRDPAALTGWSAWTATLLRQYPQHPVALYLAADAELRTGRLAEAIEGFTKALQVQQDFALARNARGVAHVLSHAWDEAEVDFYLTTKLAPRLADAYANLGTLSVLRAASLRQGNAALEAFNRALTINPHFALAYNGRGCLHFGRGEFEQAAQDFHRAAQLSPALVVAELNEAVAVAYAAQLHTLASLEQKPGMSLESVFAQQGAALQQQRQDITQHVPDHVIAALPHMSPEDQQAVMKKYGQENVIKAVQLKIRDNQFAALTMNQESQGLRGKIGALEKLQFWNEVTRTAVAVVSAGTEAVHNLQQGWQQYLRSGSVLADGAEIVKAGVEARAENHTVQVGLGALTGNPVTSTVSSVSYALEASLKDASGGAQGRQTELTQRVALLALETRNLSGFLNTHTAKGGEVDFRAPPPQDLRLPAPLTQLPTHRSGPGERSSAQRIPSGDTPRTQPLVNPSPPQVPQPNPPQMHTPTARPGGVSTEEFARAFVDKGNWPVMTSFGLLYSGAPGMLLTRGSAGERSRP
jgi:tetratricopeptide (TPR) repeat protein